MIKSIGKTHLIHNEYLSDRHRCSVFLKAEYLNPGMSAKDRPALYMIEHAERQGLLKPGFTVVEASSGNTAIGLAIVCKSKGYECHFFIGSKCTKEKQQLLKALGAEVTICSSSGDHTEPDSTISRAYKFVESNPRSYFCNQYNNPANSMAHYKTTGPEIWEQTNGSLTHFLAGVGTGGTISGVGKYLKEQNGDVSIIGVDPEGSVLKEYHLTGTISNLKRNPYQIEGIGRSFIPGILDNHYVDEFVSISDEEAVTVAYELVQETGFIPGFSSAAVLAALDKISYKLNSSSSVVLLFPDHGSRYLSTLYNNQWVADNILTKTNPELTLQAFKQVKG
jgi:cystathionine beta-synthase